MRFVLSVLIFGAMAALAALFGLSIIDDPERQLSTSLSKGVWLAGVITGILVAWIARIPWAEIPLRMAYWAKVQSRRLWWITVGIACVGVLMVY
jgi:hypothetical protein